MERFIEINRNNKQRIEKKIESNKIEAEKRIEIAKKVSAAPNVSGKNYIIEGGGVTIVQPQNNDRLPKQHQDVVRSDISNAIVEQTALMKGLQLEAKTKKLQKALKSNLAKLVVKYEEEKEKKRGENDSDDESPKKKKKAGVVNTTTSNDLSQDPSDAKKEAGYEFQNWNSNLTLKPGLKLYEQDPGARTKKTASKLKQFATEESKMTNRDDDKSQAKDPMRYFTEGDPSMRLTKLGPDFEESAWTLTHKHSKLTYTRLVDQQKHQAQQFLDDKSKNSQEELAQAASTVREANDRSGSGLKVPKFMANNSSINFSQLDSNNKLRGSNPELFQKQGFIPQQRKAGGTFIGNQQSGTFISMNNRKYLSGQSSPEHPLSPGQQPTPGPSGYFVIGDGAKRVPFDIMQNTPQSGFLDETISKNDLKNLTGSTFQMSDGVTPINRQAFGRKRSTQVSNLARIKLNDEYETYQEAR